VPERRSAWLVVGAQVKAYSRETHSPSRASKTYGHNASQLLPTEVAHTLLNTAHTVGLRWGTSLSAGCGYNPG